MNRNITIVIIILIIILLAFYLVWLRNRTTGQQVVTPNQIVTESPSPEASTSATVSPSPTATASATPKATPNAKIASPSAITY